MFVGKYNRMLELLWYVGFCREFPSQLADRICGHPDWNRHVKYEAIKRGYISVYRVQYRQRVVRSLRLTSLGLEYIAQRDPGALPYVMAQQDSGAGSRNVAERILRYHAQAIALIMARNAGVIFLPDQKPSLLANPLASSTPYDPEQYYFFSTQELREAIQEHGNRADPNMKTVAKSSRLLGVIVHGRYCYCLYHTGHTRMYWLAGTEENMVAAVEQVLRIRGICCEVFSEVIIGTKIGVAKKLMRVEGRGSSRYFTLSNRYNNIFFVTNDHHGDDLLGIIINPQKQLEINRRALEGMIPPLGTKFYDALTPDRRRPVVLGYTCDLFSFSNLSAYQSGFDEPTIVLCYDYQLNTIQSIVETPTEVRVMKGGDTS